MWQPEDLGPNGSSSTLFSVRLQAVEIPCDSAVDHSAAKGSVVTDSIMDEEMLVQAGFLKISPCLFECPQCRSIPLSLRAPNAVVTGRLHGAAVDAHKRECTGRGFYLGFVVDALSKIMDEYPFLTFDSLESDSFKAILQVLVGDSLLEVFSSRVLGILRTSRGHSIDTSESGTIDFMCTQKSLYGRAERKALISNKLSNSLESGLWKLELTAP
jgi:hypothetical protein